MKKTLIALFAMGTVASAATTVLVEQDFTTLDGYSQTWTDTKGTDDTSDDVTYPSVLPEGWGTANLKNNASPLFKFGTNGAILQPSWTVVSLYTENLDISSDNTYNITFNTYANNNETQCVFYLSSDTYSIAIGNSYNDHAFVSIGTTNKSVQGERLSFQVPGGGQGDTGTAIVPDVLLATSTHNETNGVQTNAGELDVHNNLTYSITLSSGLLNVSVKDINNKTWTKEVTINEDFNFSSMGWVFDGGSTNVGLKTATLKVIPEPTTATLSLLALAGLAARRRRK